uniref:Uncharacterized protein n=1 Tax=viral metagenome TaxID=1070528 RepID=A0A6H1ZCP0_9ZZZZ
MNNLARVIGPSPSEMSIEQLEEAIKREHSRVARGLEGGAYSYGTKKRKAKVSSSKTTVAKRLEKKYGMSLEEMERKLELLKKLEDAQREKGE